jgi:hypothetical protein
MAWGESGQRLQLLDSICSHVVLPANVSQVVARNQCRQIIRGAITPRLSAREIIDWSLPAKSVFNRNRPLVPKTMKRVWTGFKKFAFATYSCSAREGRIYRSELRRVRRPASASAFGRRTRADCHKSWGWLCC